MHCPRRVAKLLAFFLLTLTEGAACSIDYRSMRAGPSFAVRVNDRGRPVRGVPITLRGRDYTNTVLTGEDGGAPFRGVPPGTYQAGAAFDGGIADAVVVEVTAAGPADLAIPLRWPNRAPLPVRTPRGILRWFTAEPGQESGTLEVQLLEARTGRVLTSTRSTGGGAFRLDTPTPGLYFLRVRAVELGTGEAGGLAGSVPVEVDPRAADVEMDLEFGSTSCGVHYAANHTCPRQEIHPGSLGGQVLDSGGAPIARATVWLLQGDRAVAEHLASDGAGRFVSGKTLDGRYELVVSAPGFTTLRQPVQFARPQDAARPSTLRIELGVLGACSQAAVR